MNAAAALVILFNASNWGSHGRVVEPFPSMELCRQSLAEMRQGR